MPNPYPIELRERAVRAYEDSTETYVEVAARFAIAVSTLCEWVRQARDTGHVMPAPKAAAGTRRSTLGSSIVSCGSIPTRRRTK